MSLILLGLAAAVFAAPAPRASPSPSPLSPAPAAEAAQAAPPLPAVEPQPAPSVEDLYRSILPRPIGDLEVVPNEDPDGQAPETARASRDDRQRDDETRNALYLGSVQLTPAFHLLYVRAEGAFLDTAEPVDDRYFEMRPTISAEMPVSTAVVRGAYQGRIRRGSSFDLVESTIAHFADLSLTVPLGVAGEIAGSEHYARGVLETAEIDPGREYFFRLGRFTRHVHSLNLRLLPGGRVDGTIGGSVDVVRVDDRAAFFDHQQQAVSAQAGYEVRPALRAALGYGYTRVPFAPERPQAESHIHSIYGEMRGEVLPLTNGNVSVGYATHTSPNAGPGGNRFTGMVASARLEKSFTPSSSLTVTGTRGTHVSSFEENAFYVTTAGDVLLRAGLPFSLAVQAGAGYHRNTYRTVASSIGAPRRDEIRGWTLGLGRPVTRHAFVRADYRRERRDSNIDTFDSRSNVLMLELALGLLDADRR